MGLLDLDVRIEIEKGSHWEVRNQRIQNLKASSILINEEPVSSYSNPSMSHNYMDLEMYQAAKTHDVDGFLNILERVANDKELSLCFIFESVSPLNNTLLHVASYYGKKETVGLIAYHFPSLLTRRNSKGETALHVAAKAGHVLTAKTLIQLRRDHVESSSSSSCNGNNGCDNLLLRLENEDRNTALHEALINGHSEVAEVLIEADPEVSFYLNNEGKSPLYLAAEAGYRTCVIDMLLPGVEVNPDGRLNGKSPIHAAILNAATKRMAPDILEFMFAEEPRFIDLIDEEGRTVLHHAASIGYLEGVRYLLGKYAFAALQRDNNGFFPIHMASIEGHVGVVQELLSHCPDPEEMLGSVDDMNILHVAAKSGTFNVVSYILKNPELEKLINQKDKEGNTALHLATMNWHPKIVSALTWDQRVNLNLVNNDGFTALDAAEYHMETMASFRKLEHHEQRF